MRLRSLRQEGAIWLGFVLLALTAGAGAAGPSAPDPQEERLAAGEVLIRPADPPDGTGHGYRLLYVVPVPIEVFWRFKTDFANTWVLTNRFITAHRLVARDERRVVTEAHYSHRPGAVFRWETLLLPERRRLEFRLVNPAECGQRFNHGAIQLSPLGGSTRVEHTAFFDFPGAFFWYHYPWAGGMREFLDYTARWEQATAVRWQAHYERTAPAP
jgi:hypothetical protein